MDQGLDPECKIVLLLIGLDIKFTHGVDNTCALVGFVIEDFENLLNIG